MIFAKKTNFKLLMGAALVSMSLAACGTKSSQSPAGENEAQYIRAENSPNKKLVAVNVIPNAPKGAKTLDSLRDLAVLSCGYELISGTPENKKVGPINWFAHSTPVATFQKSAQEVTGLFITLYGITAGTALAVASLGTIDPDMGLMRGAGAIASWIASIVVGAPMVAGASYDNSLLIRRSALFAEMTGGITIKRPEFYQDAKEVIKGSGNTPIPCRPLPAGELMKVVDASSR
jgi:hypothetical protein